MIQEYSKTCISFDLDDTLFKGYAVAWGGYGKFPIKQFTDILEEYHALGCRVIIITARQDTFENRKSIEGLLIRYGLINCISKIVFTNFELKGEFAYREGSVLHYDDDIDHLNDCKQFGIQVINTKQD